MSVLITIAIAGSLMSCRTKDDPSGADSGVTDDSTVDDVDADGDGFVASEDCNDADPAINPDAIEVCNGVDDDCDDEIDEAGAADESTWYQDDDGDGYGLDDATVSACDLPDGYAAQGGDCDDTTEFANPAAVEYCDGIDNDCNGVIDDDGADEATWYADSDEDGYGDPAISFTSCDQPSGTVRDGTDCDDQDATSFPGGEEVCDGADNDCDNEIDEDASDASTWYEDGDGDGFGHPDVTAEACDEPSGYSALDSDCDDEDIAVNPDAEEICDEIDNDCNGGIDDDATDGDWYYTDADGDGFGDPATEAWACEGSDNGWDCDDADTTEPQVVDVGSASSSPDGSLSDPWTSIQDGIDGADSCVLVYGGTYTENVDFGGASVAVTGVEGADATVIDGSDDEAPTVSFMSGESADASLSGFTVTGGGGYFQTASDSYTCGSASWTCYAYTDTWTGGGIYVEGSTPTLTDLVISGNELPEATSSNTGQLYYYYEYSYGGGLAAVDAVLSISNVTVRENFADQGGGVYIDEDSDVTWADSHITANTATDGAAFQVDGGELSLENVLSTWNEASDDGGGVLAVDALLTEINVTHGGESASNGGGMYLSGTSTGSVMNTIVYGATSGEGVLSDSTATFSGLYNNIYANAGGEYSGVTNPTGSSGNLSWDPAFTDVTDDGDPDNDDWTLTASSISVDAGNPSSSYDDADGTTNDQGAYGGPNSDWND